MQPQDSALETLTALLAVASDDNMIRRPGLYPWWEIVDVLEIGVDFHIEEATRTADGTRLFAVYRRELAPSSPASPTPPARSSTKEQ